MNPSKGRMTKEEILTMEAGNELDKVIGETIMELISCDDWEYFNLGSAGGPVLRKTCSHKRDGCYPTKTIDSTFGKVGGCPRYSTDISAAWQVVEELIKQYVFNLYYDDVGELWVCKLFDGQQEHKGYGNMPEAICKAALLAKLEGGQND